MHIGERRANSRVDCEVRVEIDGLSEAMSLTTRDLSAGGVFLFHRQPMPLNLEFDLRLSTGARTVRLRGTVVHHLPGVGFGVRFDTPDADAQEHLARFLECVQIRAA